MTHKKHEIPREVNLLIALQIPSCFVLDLDYKTLTKYLKPKITFNKPQARDI